MIFALYFCTLNSLIIKYMKIVKLKKKRTKEKYFIYTQNRYKNVRKNTNTAINFLILINPNQFKPKG